MSKHYETNFVHPLLVRAFQWYQEHGKRHYGLGELNMTNKQNQQTTFFHRQITLTRTILCISIKKCKLSFSCEQPFKISFERVRHQTIILWKIWLILKTPNIISTLLFVAILICQVDKTAREFVCVCVCMQKVEYKGFGEGASGGGTLRGLE